MSVNSFLSTALSFDLGARGRITLSDETLSREVGVIVPCILLFGTRRTLHDPMSPVTVTYVN